jgi:hypothetical protein
MDCKRLAMAAMFLSQMEKIAIFHQQNGGARAWRGVERNQNLEGIRMHREIIL